MYYQCTELVTVLGSVQDIFFGSGSSISAPITPIKARLHRLRLQNTDFDTKHLKNLKKEASINLDFVPKTKKNYKKIDLMSIKKLILFYT